MAITGSTYDTVTKTTVNAAGTSVSTRSRQMRYRAASAKVNGQFTTLPDGSKFRKATPITRVDAELRPTGGQNITGKSKTYNQPFSVVTSSGGWSPDTLFKSAFPPIGGSVGSVNSISNAPSIPAGMRNEAVTKALLDIAGQKAGLGEDLATWMQTVNMIKNPVQTLVREIRRGRNTPAWRHLLRLSPQTIRNRWNVGVDLARGPAAAYISYVYGLQPLVNDVYGVMQLLRERGNNALLLSGEGKSIQQGQTRQRLLSDTATKATTTLFPLNESAQVRCKIWGRIDPNATGLRTANQLGLLNPVSLAWNLVPWSFVVDWLIPIGPVLEALTAPMGLIFVDGSVSCKTTLSGEYESQTNESGNSLSISPGRGNVSCRLYNRQVLSGWPLPGFYLDNNPFRGDRPLKALALSVLQLRHIR